MKSAVIRNFFRLFFLLVCHAFLTESVRRHVIVPNKAQRARISVHLSRARARALSLSVLSLSSMPATNPCTLCFIRSVVAQRLCAHTNINVSFYNKPAMCPHTT